MRRMKKLLAFLLAAMLLVSLSLTAAAEEGGKYTVKIKPGRVARLNSDFGGTVSEATGTVTIEVNPGDSMPVSLEELKAKGAITLTDEAGEKAYYVTGVKESSIGLDEDGSLPSQVNQNIELVLDYGVLIDPVDYVIRYVDTEGNPLAAQLDSVGNAGDVVHSKAKVIEGYTVDSETKSLTLSGEAGAANELVFVYTYIPGETHVITNTQTNIQYVDGGTRVETEIVPGQPVPDTEGEDGVLGERRDEETDGQTAGGSGEASEEETAETQTETAAETETASEAETETEAESEVQTQQQETTVTEEEVPLADAPAENTNMLAAGLGILILLVVIILVVYIMKKKTADSGKEEK